MTVIEPNLAWGHTATPVYLNIGLYKFCLSCIPSRPWSISISVTRALPLKAPKPVDSPKKWLFPSAPFTSPWLSKWGFSILSWNSSNWASLLHSSLAAIASPSYHSRALSSFLPSIKEMVVSRASLPSLSPVASEWLLSLTQSPPVTHW